MLLLANLEFIFVVSREMQRNSSRRRGDWKYRADLPFERGCDREATSLAKRAGDATIRAKSHVAGAKPPESPRRPVRVDKPRYP
jgi:hypothetical protein